MVPESSVEAAGFDQGAARFNGCRDYGRQNGRQWTLSKDREIGKTWNEEESFFGGAKGLCLEKENKLYS